MKNTNRNLKLQRDITFAQNRLNAKVVALPKLEVSNLDETMKQRYLDSIEHERQLIATWTERLTK